MNEFITIILIAKKRFSLEYEPLNKISHIIFINLYFEQLVSNWHADDADALGNADFRRFLLELTDNLF